MDEVEVEMEMVVEIEGRVRFDANEVRSVLELLFRVEMGVTRGVKVSFASSSSSICSWLRLRW